MTINRTKTERIEVDGYALLFQDDSTDGVEVRFYKLGQPSVILPQWALDEIHRFVESQMPVKPAIRSPYPYQKPDSTMVIPSFGPMGASY